MTEEQKMQRDSLELYFKIANDDYVPYQQRLDNTEKALAIVQQQEKDTMYRVNLFKVANRYWNVEKYEDYKRIVDIIAKESIKKQDSFSLGKANYFLGDYYFKKLISDSTYNYYFASEKIFKKIKNTDYQGKALILKSTFLYYYGDLYGAEKNALKTLRLLRNKKITFPQDRYEAYNILGVVYSDLKMFDKSLEFHLKALEKASEVDVSFEEHQAKNATLMNIGLVYQYNDYYKLAIINYNKALKDSQTVFIQRKELFLGLKQNLIYSKFKNGDYCDFPKGSFDLLNQIDSINNSILYITLKMDISEYFLAFDETANAKKYVSEAYRLAKSKKLSIPQLSCLKQLSKIDPKNASKYAAEYFKINDSLQLAERTNRNKFARIEYETEELEIEKANLQTQRIYIVYTAVALLLLLIAIIIIRYQRSKNRELQYNQQQQKANSEIYKLMLDQQQKIEEGKQIEKKRISKELHDGVMGRLTSIRLNLFILSKKTDKETIDKCLHHISEIQNIEKEIRNIAYDLGINIFSDNINFETVVRNLFAEIESHSEIQFILKTDEQIDWEAVHINIKMQIYRVLQEALQNIDKYAQAKNVIINMRKVASDINVIITDDGIGFEKSKIKKGFGLNNMKDRIKTINGKITVRSAVGEGTTINVIVPVPEDYFVAV
jgi:signal transduction histidine kinase